MTEDISGIFQNEAFDCINMIALVGASAGVIAKELIKHNEQHKSRRIKFVLSGTIQKAVTILFDEAKKQKNKDRLDKYYYLAKDH